MNALKLVCIGIVVALLAPPALVAQDTPVESGEKGAVSPVVPGVRVRVTVQKELYWSLSDTKSRLVGTVASIGDNKLMLGYKDQATPLELPFESVTRVEISRGSRGPSILKAAGVGLLAGATFGAIIGYTDGDDEPGFLALTAAEKALGGAIVFGAIGLVVGLVVGLVSSGEKWETVPDPFGGLDAGISPQRGLSLAVSRRF